MRGLKTSLILALLLVAATGLAAKSSQAPLTLQPAGGVFTNNVSVSISTSGPGSIHYTLDGSEPNDQSPVYSAPISVTNSVMVRARRSATGSNAVQSTTSQTYIVVDDDLAGFSSNLPLVLINTFGQEIEHESKTAAAARIIKLDGKRCSITGAADFDGRALVNIRGRASLRYPKRSFAFRPLNEEDDYLKTSLLGLPSDSDWILYAPYPDKTFLRDVLAYKLSNEMGQYASRTRFVEVFVNETPGKLAKAAYMGVYVLEEKIKRSKERVDIAKLGPDNNAEPKLTGGYIFKKDHGPDGGEVQQVNLGGFPGGQQSTSTNRVGYPTGPGGFPADPGGFLPPYNGPVRESTSSSSRRSSSTAVNVTNRIGLILEEADENAAFRFSSSSSSGSSRERFTTKPLTNEFYYVYPEPDEITAAQRSYLAGLLTKVETALTTKDFANPKSGYPAYIDSLSFIDHHILVEVSKNVDGFRFSTYFHKDRGGKIKAGPIWDWNLSFGNANGKQGWMPEYWLWPQLTDKEYSWYRKLFQDPDFAQQYVDRWAQLRTNIFDTARIFSWIDQTTNLLQEAQVRNYEKWPVLGRQVWPQYTWGDTYADEVKFMKDWITNRLAWIDAQFLAAPQVKLSDGKLTLSVAKGEIFYTTDGNDPRQSGGNPRSEAVKYSSPAALPAKGKIFARAFEKGRWSAPGRSGF